MRQLLPRPPTIQMQEQFMGESGKGACVQACGFKKVCIDQLHRLNVSLSGGSRILDFGCGWGSLSRVFLTGVGTMSLFAVDVLEHLIAETRE